MILTPGQAGDNPQLVPLLEQVAVKRDGPGRPRKRPDRVLADRAYSSPSTRRAMRARGIAFTSPEKADHAGHRLRRGSRGGRPPAFDTEIYKGRNVVERCFNKLKQWRGLAMRSDKYARNYHAGICLAATLDWLRTGFSNTPYDRARNRGCRHPHAARILAQGWTRILWRCWHDHQPYNPDLHGRLNTLQQEAA